MQKEVFISTRGKKHAVALVEGGKLVEFNSENEDEISIVGNIYKGRVEQVLKGMQAAFVNIGRAKNAYLYMSDTIVDGQDLTEAQEEFQAKTLEAKVGDEIMVQVSKTEIGLKGARLSPNVSLAGKFLVYMPTVNYIGVSRKIVNEAERERLTAIIENLPDRNGGYIIRTACENASEDELVKDAVMLQERWQTVLDEYEKAKVTDVVYNDGCILFRLVRDVVSKGVTQIIVDDQNTFERMKNYIISFGLDVNILKLFDVENMDLFNYYGLTAQVLRVLDCKVELENGAYLVIENTEALTVIDVNTGKYVGNSSLEETVFETNTLAAKAIAAQLRLRNVGGIIIVDFIDMQNDDHKEIVMQTLAEAVKKDRVRTSVVDMTALGLVEITRKKSRSEVKQNFSRPCKVCGGKGYVMTNETLTTMIKSKLFEMFSNEKVTACQITVNSANALEFFENRAFTFEITVFWADRRIYVLKDDSMSINDYDIKPF
ncbi:MAG: Rne/Rng family ribonuclease, partial [Clostridia bacterium]